VLLLCLVFPSCRKAFLICVYMILSVMFQRHDLLCYIVILLDCFLKMQLPFCNVDKVVFGFFYCFERVLQCYCYLNYEYNLTWNYRMNYMDQRITKIGGTCVFNGYEIYAVLITRQSSPPISTSQQTLESGQCSYNNNETCLEADFVFEEI